MGGIGAAIRYYEAKDRIAVVEPTEGMPAAEAGVKAGDIILSVGGKGNDPWNDETSGFLAKGE